MRLDPCENTEDMASIFSIHLNAFRSMKKLLNGHYRHHNVSQKGSVWTKALSQLVEMNMVEKNRDFSMRVLSSEFNKPQRMMESLVTEDLSQRTLGKGKAQLLTTT